MLKQNESSPPGSKPKPKSRMSMVMKRISLLAAAVLGAGVLGGQAQVVITPDLAAPDGAVDTSERGFKVYVHQQGSTRAYPIGGDQNTLGQANAQLEAGKSGEEPNLVDLTETDADGLFTRQVINWDQNGGDGEGGDRFDPNDLIPGLEAGAHDNIVSEITGYIELPAGETTLVVNSDDGFLLTIGVETQVYDVLAAQAGIFNAGRAPADTVMTIDVQEADIYPMRLVWWEGGGGAALEFFEVQDDGTRVLVNDPDNAEALKVYTTAEQTGLPYATSVSPMPNSTGVLARPSIEVELTDDVTAVNPDSVVLMIDDAEVTPTVSRDEEAGTTTISYMPDELLPAGSTPTVTVMYDDDGDPATTSTRSFSFTVESYLALDPAVAIDMADVDDTAVGFNVSVHVAHLDAGLANSVLRAESQSRGYLINPETGFPYINNAATATGLYHVVDPDVINWLQFSTLDAGGTEGYFAEDENIPGVPGFGGEEDNIAANITTFLDLPAGSTVFGVRSDDGFAVYTPEPGVNNPWQLYGATLHAQFNAGRGSGLPAGDTRFTVMVEEAGIYPVRLVWFEGGGGASLEFYSLVDGEPVLVNDRDNGGISAYHSLTTDLEPIVDQLSPAPGAVNVPPSADIVVRLRDSTTIDMGSVQLMVEGEDVTAESVISTDPDNFMFPNDIVIAYTPSPKFGSGVEVMASVEYTPNGGTATTAEWSFTTGGEILLKTYTDIGGTSVDNLLGNAKFPLEPDRIEILGALEADPAGDPSNYGGEFLGYIHPPVTGDYVFAVAADDNARVWLSTDESPANKVLIAQEPTWNNFRDYNTADRRNAADPENFSDPIFLEEGQRYFVQAMWKEGGTGDHISVTWQKPGDPPISNGQAPIGGAALSAFSGVALSASPQDLTVDEGETAEFTADVVAVEGPLAIQWLRDGVDIPGANELSYTIDAAFFEDNGAEFQIRVGEGDDAEASAIATLTVIEDVTDPELIGAGTVDGLTVAVCFSEALDPGSVSLDDFTITSGSIVDAMLDDSGRTVFLTVSGLDPADFSVELTGTVTDVAGNEAAAGTVEGYHETELTAQDVGAVSEAGLATACGPGDYQLRAGGADWWGTEDQGIFLFETITGDFDKRVRVEYVEPVNRWAKAGIDIRESQFGDVLDFVDTGDRHLSAYVMPEDVPTQDGADSGIGRNAYEAGQRAEINGATAAWHSTQPPPPYPNAWIRVTRVGNEFTAYHSDDGVSWEQWASASPDPAYVDTLNVGLFTTSHNNDIGMQADAIFRSYGDTPEAPTVTITAPEDGANLPAGSAVTISADATAAGDATIAQVEFFANGESLGVDTEAPYSIEVADVPAGQYTVVAVATDSDGVPGEATIFVTVGDAAEEILFVVSNADSLNASDQMILDRMMCAGYAVRVVSAPSSTTEDAAFAIAVAVSSTVNSGDVGTKFRDVDIPVVMWEQAVQDDFLLTTDVDGTTRGNLDGQTILEVVAPSHPLAAGLPLGNVTATTTALPFSYGVPEGAGAEIAINLGDGSGRAAVYGYDSGSELVDGSTAPARRGFLFMGDNAFAALTDEGVAIFDAMMAWALEDSFVCSIEEAPELTITAEENGDVTISWTPDEGTLVSAPEVTGPWTATADQSNPQTITPTEDQQFFGLEE